MLQEHGRTTDDMALLPLAANQIDEGIVITDVRGLITWVNVGFCRICGYMLDELVGRKPGDVLQGPLTDAATVEQIRAALRAKQPCAVDILNYHKNGHPYWISLHITPLLDACQEVIRFIAIEHDITSYKQALAALETREERLALERRLLETQKLESLGVLAGGIAHDFNNLLAAILGNAELALLDTPRESPARQSLVQILGATRRAAHLTGQMLAYSGHGHFLVQPLDLNALLHEMNPLLQATVPKQIELRYQLAPSLPFVVADANQIRQVIVNVIANAAEAIGDQPGEITITTGLRDVTRADLAAIYAAPSLTEGEHVFFAIADTGVGMDAYTQARICEPFFTTKFAGRGLGLAAVQGIVRGHRGGIAVKSAPAQGTTVTVMLPRSSASPRQTKSVE